MQTFLWMVLDGHKPPFGVAGAWQQIDLYHREAIVPQCADSLFRVPRQRLELFEVLGDGSERRGSSDLVAAAPFLAFLWLRPQSTAAGRGVLRGQRAPFQN
jgi:hypothetical protein